VPPFGFFPQLGLRTYTDPGSRHIGGLQIVMGDGSVRFLSQYVDQAVKVAIFGIGEGNIVGEY
jgi:prepilin-type processing-associated H-X9-DG protein